MKTLKSTFRKVLFLFLIVLYSNGVFAQSYSISGKLVDEHDSIVPTASIILVTQSDSAFVRGVISDMQGEFSLSDVAKGKYLLFIQHVIYEKKRIPLEVAGAIQLGSISLHEVENELGEISVKATRPVVKMKDNVLSYDVAAVSTKFVRSNALEVLGDIPGVLLKNESVQLLGASQLSVAINGKPTTLSMDQVLTMLKAMPNTSIKEVQVMYAPPAKYNVKGSLINIVLNKAANDELNGSVTLGYEQRKKSGGNGGFNIQFSKGKWETGLLYSGNYKTTSKSYEIDINHTYRDTLYAIRQDMSFPNKLGENNIQFNTAYHISEKQNLSLVYTGNFSTSDQDHVTDATFSSVKGISVEKDITTGNDDENMHNLKLDYSLNDQLNIGADYTHFNGPSTQNYQSTTDGVTDIYRTTSEQTVNKWMGYINHTVKFKKDWSVNYGLNYSYSQNDNYYRYFDYSQGGYNLNEKQSSANNYKESAASGFIGFSKQITSKLSAEFSLKGEYDKMIKDTLGTHRTLWSGLKFYPTVNLSFIPDSSSNHIFQLSLESYATYPTYWEVSPATWYTNKYMLIQGNPELQPSQTYDASLKYIFHRKYVAVLSYDRTSKMINQIPFASEETFNTIARNENLDYGSNLTLAFILPFNLGSRIHVNPTIGAFHRVMKREGVGEQSFNRSGNTFIFQFDNSLILSKKYDLKFNLSGYYYNNIIQAIYDIDDVADVSCAISCPVLKKKAELSLKVKDIFSSNAPVSRIDFNNQQSVYYMHWDSRMLLVTFKYNFGKVLKDKKVEIDDSRFKRMQ